MTVVPYVRGYYDRDFLYKLWCLIEAEGDWPRIFWNDPYDRDRPVERYGDLTDWVGFWELGNKSWLLVLANDTREIAGLLWFDRQTETNAYGNIWMARKYRGGGYARDTVQLGTEYGLYFRGWKEILTVSPWYMARNLVRRCGWKPLGELSGVYTVCGEAATVYFSKITLEDYEQWEREAPLK